MLPASCRQCFPPIGLPARCQQHSAVHGKPHDIDAVQWDHEAIRIPLSRPSATLSPAQSGGEGRERGRFNGERASSALRLCIGALNPLVLVLVLEDNSPNRGRAGRRGGNGGSWKASFGPASVSGSRRSIGVGSNCSPVFSRLFFCSAVGGPVCPEAEFRGTAWSLWP